MKGKNKESKVNLIDKINNFIDNVDSKITDSKGQKVSINIYEVLKKIIVFTNYNNIFCPFNFR